MTLFFKANCSGLVLIVLIVTLWSVGFYNYAKIIVETPNGDFILLMTTEGFGWHLRLN